jgi:hypothetical protein
MALNTADFEIKDRKSNMTCKSTHKRPFDSNAARVYHSPTKIGTGDLHITSGRYPKFERTSVQ